MPAIFVHFALRGKNHLNTISENRKVKMPKILHASVF